MQIKDFDLLGEMMAELYIIKGKPMPQGAIDVWAKFLLPYTIEQLMRAFEFAKRDTSEQWPRADKIAEIIDSEGLDEEVAFWWEDLTDNATKYFIDRDLYHENTNETCRRSVDRIGGLKRIDGASAQDLVFIRKEFVETFNKIRKGEQVAKIVIPQIENKKQGMIK